MGQNGDADPFERYFRPRPTDSGTPADEPAGSGEGVTVAGTPAPRVPVDERGPRRPGPGLSPRAAMSARRQRRFLATTGAMSALVLFGTGAAWGFQTYVVGALDRVDVGGLGEGDGPKGALTVLIAGVDRREGLTKEQQRRARLGSEAGERSDTLLLVRISRDHDRVTVVSLPRDSLVTIPAHKANGVEAAAGTPIPARQGKLTWAYQYGGATLTVETVKRATGVSIDHYVEVNFYGFVHMVDALGGVDVCVEQAVDDKKSGLRLPAGTSHVNGLQALAFTRARYTLTGGSDLGRIDRQQQFIAAMMRQALSSKTLSDPVKSTRFLQASLKSLRVDPKLAKNLPGLVDQMKNLSTDSVVFAKIPLKSENYMTPINGSAPQSTVLWEGQKVNELFTRLDRDQAITPSKSPSPTPSPTEEALTVPPGDISVVVRNGVGTQGLAARAGGDLRRAGFPVTVAPGVARTGLKTTTIQYGRGRADSARTLAAALPGARLKEVPALGSRLQIIVGADWSGARKVKITKSAVPPAATVEASTASQKLCK
jgi:LCP family protein required for cell wall assembly